MIAERETTDSFACFGSRCAVLVTGGDGAREAVASARRQLVAWQERFTRFAASSELSRLNADPREVVPVSAVMARFVQAVLAAAEQTDGLVDGTLAAELEATGYRTDLPSSLPLELALRLAPRRQPAAGHPAARWREVSVRGSSIHRPIGVRFDSGGIAKGLFADLLARRLTQHASFAVDCAGDLRVGGAAGLERPVRVSSPIDRSTMHTYALADAGVATSGIGRRSWLGEDGQPAHHLLDPSTGRAAFTGLIQVTAIAPTALAAEIRAKAALLSGPGGAERWLPDGGVLVHDDGTHRVV